MMPRNDLPRIVILGAGPIGLEALLYAQALNLPAVVYERGRIGEYLHRWGHVRLFSPFAMNTTPLGRKAIRAENPRHDFPADGDCITGREHLTAYLEPLAQLEAVRTALRTQTEVLHIGRRGCLKDDDTGDARRARQPFRLILREGNKERAEQADIVLDCTGTYGRHRWLGDGGIPALGEVTAEAQIAYGMEDVCGERRQHYAGRNVLVVGAGYSAATSVCSLATLAEKHMETWVTWLARGPGTQPLRRIPADPLRERDQLAMRANNLATRGDGNVRFLNQAVVESIEALGQDKGFKVRGRVAGTPTTWNVERVIANVGYTPDAALYRELQVHECYASLGPMKLAAALAGQRGVDCLKQTGHGPETLRNPEPNFFILGAKSYGRNTHFLLRIGFEQVRDVFTLITGKTNLDLYGKPPS
jgi:thioredoxin reductase